MLYQVQLGKKLWMVLGAACFTVSCSPQLLISAKLNSSSGTAASTTINLEVPIEMTNVSMGGNVGTADFSNTPLNTTEYDGSPQYFFEIVAKNTDGVAHSVYLVDGTPTTYATVSVPSGTATATLFSRVQFTPQTGLNRYFVSLDAGTATAFMVYSARIIVRQTGATKTRIYIPMGGSNYAVNVGTSMCGAPCFNSGAPGVNGTNYTAVFSNLGFHPFWKKRSGYYPATSTTTTPWTLETVVGAWGGGSTVGLKVALYNSTHATIVPDSEIVLSGTSGDSQHVDFSDSATLFNSDDTYEIRLSGGIGYALKVGLWVSLSNITQMEIPIRVMSGGRTGTLTDDGHRQNIDLSRFSNPRTFFEISSMTAANTNQVDLLDHGTNDVGTAGTSAVVNATITVSSLTGNLQRSPEISLTSGDRYFGKNTKIAADNIYTANGFVWIQISP